MLNKAILVGRLTADPELRQTANGIPVTSFSIAIDRPYRNGAERQTDFINIVTWRQSAEFVSRYFRKGNAIAIDGSIQVRQYTDRDGNKRTAVEVVADRCSFVESRNAQQSYGQNAPAAPSSSENFMPFEQPSVSFSSGDADSFQVIEDEEDLPF